MCNAMVSRFIASVQHDLDIVLQLRVGDALSLCLLRAPPDIGALISCTGMSTGVTGDLGASHTLQHVKHVFTTARLAYVQLISVPYPYIFPSASYSNSGSVPPSSTSLSTRSMALFRPDVRFASPNAAAMSSSVVRFFAFTD